MTLVPFSFSIRITKTVLFAFRPAQAIRPQPVAINNEMKSRRAFFKFWSGGLWHNYPVKVNWIICPAWDRFGAGVGSDAVRLDPTLILLNGSLSSHNLRSISGSFS